MVAVFIIRVRVLQTRGHLKWFYCREVNFVASVMILGVFCMVVATVVTLLFVERRIRDKRQAKVK